MRSLLVALILALASPAHAQLTASASLVGMAHTSVGWGQSRDRETFGVRYRTPAVKGATLQAGYTMTSDNGIVFPSSGGVRHFAVAPEFTVTDWIRASAIYGILLEFRDPDTRADSVSRDSYYRINAVGLEAHRGAYGLTVERLLAAPMARNASLHHWIIRGRSPSLDLMVRQLGASPKQAPYRFWTAEATLHPLGSLPPPYRYVGVQGGTRALLDPIRDTSHPVAFVATGFFFAWSDR